MGSNPTMVFSIYFQYFFVLLRLVIFLWCRYRLTRFVQHIGVRISNHEQPNGKLRSLKTMIKTCRQVIIFYYPLMHDNKDPNLNNKKIESGVQTYDFKPSIILKQCSLTSYHCTKTTMDNRKIYSLLARLFVLLK